MTSTRTFSKLLIAAALALPMAALPSAQAHAAIVISVGFAPPVLPVYTQPYCPGPGYMWQPGYWAYGPDGYYWVPGVWVLPPEPGLLWTPAWWGWEGNAYIFHTGYWGPHVGFYGGIDYGFGYNGVGFYGGEWRGNTFYYNRSVANIGTGFHNVYSRPVAISNHSRVAFNGGRGGIQARPTAQENSWSHERHVAPTANQVSHQNFASQNRAQHATANGGRPGVPAAATVNSFHSNPNNAAMAARPTNQGPHGTNRQQAPRSQPQPRPQMQSQPHPQMQPQQQRPAQPQAQPRQSQGHPSPEQHGGGDHGDHRH